MQKSFDREARVMGNEQLRVRAKRLHELIIGSSTGTAWADSSPGGVLLDWQRDVISKILTLTYDQDIEYLSTAMPTDEDWDIIAFTESTVVRVLMERDNGGTAYTDTSAFPRSSLESLELVDVDPVPGNDDVWPSGLNMIGHYRSATVTLPLDRFASTDNRRDLLRLLTSLLQDVGH